MSRQDPVVDFGLRPEPGPLRRVLDSATGDILYASSSSVIAKLAIGSAGEVLAVSSGLPSWEPPGTPGAHSFADTSGLGASHTTSGLTDGFVLRASGATTAKFQALIAADIPNLNTAKITTGTLADALVAESNITQHEAALAIGAAQVAAGTFGAGTFVLDKLGINAPSPGRKFDVEGEGDANEDVARFNVQGDFVCRLLLRQAARTGQWAIAGTSADTAATGMLVGAMTWGVGSAVSPLQFWNGSPAAVRLTIASDGDFDFVTGKTKFNTVEYTWPGSDGGAGNVLSTNGSGILSWTAGGAGALGGSGTAGKIAKWSAAATLTDSIISESGSVATVTGSLAATVDVRGSIIDRDGAVINVKHPDYGVIGDGASGNEKAEIQAAFDAASDGDTILFPAGEYVIGQVGGNQAQDQVHVTGKDLVILAHNAEFTLIGDYAGFLFDGVINNAAWHGGRFTGDSTDRDADPTEAQVPLILGNSAGANIDHFYVYDLWVTGTNIGIKLAAGTGGGSGPTSNCAVVNPRIDSIIGAVGGMGYGVQFSDADGSILLGGKFSDVGRHSVYVAAGNDYRIIGVDITTHAETSGETTAAMAIARSSNVEVTGCLFHDISGADCLRIDTASGSTMESIRIDSCTFHDVGYRAIRIGNLDPATDGVPIGVSVSNITIKPGVASPGGSSFRVDSVDGLYLSNIVFDLEEVTLASHRALVFAGIGGDTWTNNVVVDGVFVNIPNNIAAIIQLPAVSLVGSGAISIRDITIQGSLELPVEYVGGINSVTNVNLRVYGTKRVLTAPGATPWAGGASILEIQNSGAQTITDLLGGESGQVVTLIFLDGNITISADFFISTGAYTPTTNDTLTLAHRAGIGWFEVARSAN